MNSRKSLVILSLASVSSVWAAGISKPNTFSSGGTVSSSQVNANFDTLYTEVNNKESRITTLEAKNTTLYTSSSSNISIPAGVNGVSVEVIGGGGGGGTYGYYISTNMGGSGGNGAYAKGIYTGAALNGGSITVTVGTGGAASTTAGSCATCGGGPGGSAGGTSSAIIKNSGGTVVWQVSASGGNGGGDASGGASCTNGPVGTPGGNGGSISGVSSTPILLQGNPITMPNIPGGGGIGGGSLTVCGSSPNNPSAGTNGIVVVTYF